MTKMDKPTARRERDRDTSQAWYMQGETKGTQLDQSMTRPEYQTEVN